MPKETKQIIYSDAHYSYTATSKPPEGVIVSHGRVVSDTKNFIDLELTWTENPHRTIFGLVIPKGVIHSKIRDPEIKKRDSYAINDIIAVYWNDVFAYDDKYVGPHKPTPMLTEGTLFRETESYIILDNPETLNLADTTNHPEKKPRRYFIPKAMIGEIKLVKRPNKL